MYRLLLILILSSIVAYSVSAQNHTINGTVLDQEGLPLPGVNILEKGTTQSATSDASGNFTIDTTEGATLVFSFIGYVNKEVKIVSGTFLTITMDIDAVYCGPVVEIGYGHLEQTKVAGSVTYHTDNNFNRGNIYDPALLWQGRIPGLSIYNRGGNPHSQSTMRIRGLTTFDGEAQPLIVLDGVPMATLGNVDPQDIASVTVLKDGASAAIYGMRGSNGVILITTKRGSTVKGLSVNFQTEGAASRLLQQQPVLNANEYIAAGGNDLGSNTNWQEEITRTGYSHAHHLSISGSHQNSSFRVSTHYRSVNSVLNHAGFDQANTRVNVTHAAVDSRLRFTFNMSFTNRNSNFSFPEAFRYATLFNPTSPIRFANGKFYQAILFDNYNPVALLDQNVNEGRRKSTNYGGKIDFDITSKLTATVNVGHQIISNLNGKYYSRESFYIGLDRGGYAERYTDDQYFTLAESYLTYRHTKDKLMLSMTGGYSFQQDRKESFIAGLGNYPNDELGYNALGYSADIILGQSNLINISSTSTPDNKIVAGFARAHLDIGNGMNFFGTLRYEGSSKLGSNNKSGLFSSLGTNVDLLHYMKRNNNLQTMNIRLSYGITGAVPTQAGLAQDRYQYNLANGGTVFRIQGANPDLKWEQKNEINVGFDVGLQKFSGSLDVYKRKIKDIIQSRYADLGGGDFTNKYMNAAALSSKGLEFTLNYHAGQWGGLQWLPSLVISNNQVVVEEYPVQQELRASGEGCGCSTLLVRTAVGEKVGQLWSPVFSGVSNTGYPLMKDTNGDGIITVSAHQALDSNTDFTDAGYGIPSWEIGWDNKLTYRNWQLQAFFRGVFGHSLVNSLRMAHEPQDLGAINSYNRMRTDKSVAGLTSSLYSSLYVERADFFMLDNLTLEYSIPIKSGRGLSAVKVYGTIQRVFTITGYSGVDPEPALFDYHSTVLSMERDVLAPGIDRMGNYFPARTFTIAVSLGF